MIEVGIVSYLKNNTAVAALVGTRIYPDRLPQNPTLPAVVFLAINDGDDYSHSGRSQWKEQRLQFDCWAKDPLAAITLKEALRAALSGYAGMMGATKVYVAFVENGRTLDDDETGLFRRILEADIQFQDV